MTRFKDLPVSSSPAVSDDELRRLGQQLFAEVQKASAKDEAEFSVAKYAGRALAEIVVGQLPKLRKGDSDAEEVGNSCGIDGFCGGD